MMLLLSETGRDKPISCSSTVQLEGTLWQRQDMACPCLCLAFCSRITRSQRWNDGLPSRSPARPRVRRFRVRLSRARRDVTGALTFVRHKDNPAWICRILLPQITFPAHKKTYKLPTYICRLCCLGSLSRVPYLGRHMPVGTSMATRSLLARVISVRLCRFVPTPYSEVQVCRFLL